MNVDMDILDIPNFSIIVGFEEHSRGIGANGGIPWNVPEDMKAFRTVTSQLNPEMAYTNPNTQNAVIMGLNTWLSLKAKPLPGRRNVLVSTSTIEAAIPFYRTLEEALVSCKDCSSVFIIGGQYLYEKALSMQQCRSIFSTVLSFDEQKTTIEQRGFVFDRFMPSFEQNFTLTCSNKVKTSTGHATFQTWKRDHQELRYLDLVKDVLLNGKRHENRTGTDTFSVIGRQIRFDISNEFPLFTCKRVFWKGVVAELFWFLRGQTDAKILSEQGVKIWDDNTSKEFLLNCAKTARDSGDEELALHFEQREVGDAGPVYGHHWRHWAADDDYEGFDQIKKLISTIKTSPNSRQMMLTSYDPKSVKYAVLFPCHPLSHWTVRDGKLNCQLFQRSLDIGLGGYFNIASYALLTKMIAHVCGLEPGEFIYDLGDAHIYENHVNQLKEILTRLPTKLPTVRFARSIHDIDDFKPEDIILENYTPHAAVKMDMAI